MINKKCVVPPCADDSKEELFMKGNSNVSTRQLVTAAVLTAVVVVLQFMGAFIKFGPFSISLVLIPIVVGAALCGVGCGAWLGFVFGAVVLASGDAGLFLGINPLGTVVTVLAKGALCGLAAGIVFRYVKRFNMYAAVVAAAVVCPIVNTCVFLIGCKLFFMSAVRGWAQAAGFGADSAKYMIFSLVGVNFLVEMGINVVLSPAVIRILKIRKRN